MDNLKIQEISFFPESAEFVFVSEEEIIHFLSNLLIKRYNKEEFILNYIALSIDGILEMNNKYLQHDYPTDVISFDFSEEFGVFGGDIFMCPEVIKLNSEDLNIEYSEELLRVIIHGLLHFLGFDDTDDDLQSQMRLEEEVCLNLYRSEFYS